MQGSLFSRENRTSVVFEMLATLITTPPEKKTDSNANAMTVLSSCFKWKNFFLFTVKALTNQDRMCFALNESNH